MLFICYPKCSTCKKAKKWLDEHGVSYTTRHIVEDNPHGRGAARFLPRALIPSPYEIFSPPFTNFRPRICAFHTYSGVSFFAGT